MNRKHSPRLTSYLINTLILLFVFFWNSAQAQTITISGTFSLPTAAPLSGVTFEMTTCDSTEAESCDNEFLAFTVGQTSKPYSLTVNDNGSSSWRVEASCTANCDDHMDYIVYSSTETNNSSHDSDLRTELAGGSNHSNIDFSAMEAVNISGTVTFPSGVPAPAGGMELHVNTHDVNDPTGDWYVFTGGTSEMVAGGATSFPYTIKVVKTASSLFVNVWCPEDQNSGGECNDYTDSAYYANPNSIHNFEDADELTGGVDHANIDIDIIKANRIEGTISLPSGTASAGGLEIELIADKYDTWDFAGNHWALMVPAGASSAEYKIKFPADFGSDLRVRAECESGSPKCDSYVEMTYYNNTIGSTPIRGQGTTLASTQNHSDIDFALFEKYSGPAITCDMLLDDFSGASLDMDKWYDMETTRELASEGTDMNELILSQKLISDEDRSTWRQRFNANLAESPSKNTVEAMVKLTEADLTATNTGTVDAGLAGTYYSTLSSPVTDDQTGDVYADVQLGDRGSGLEAWWEIISSSDSGFNNFTVEDSGTLTAPGGGWMLNTEYLVKIVYDGSNGFDFTVGTATASGTGPTRMAASPQEFRRLKAAAFPENNTDSDPISVKAAFDDVKTNGLSYDNFDGAGVTMLDLSNWTEPQAKRFLTGGKLRMESISQSTSRVSYNARPELSRYGDAECLQATLNLKDTSIPNGTRGRVRIEGQWYNALYNATSGYNGDEGIVWAHLALDRHEDGYIQASLWMEQATDADWNTYEEIMWFRFEDADPLSFNTDYVALIMLDRPNKRMLFRFHNETYIVPILTKIYPMDPNEKYVSLRTRLQDGPGVLHAEFDDVKVSEADYDSDGMPNRTDDDDDGDGMLDTHEDGWGLNPLDEEDADTDPDNDGLTSKEEHDISSVQLDPFDPDSDGDEVDDGRDMDPAISNNSCTSSTTTFDSVVTGPIMCGTAMPISVDPPAEVQDPNGHLWIAAPSANFNSGFRSGRVTVVTGSDPGFPCSNCIGP